VQQRVALLEAADLEDLIKVALAWRWGLEHLEHPLDGPLATAVWDGRVARPLRDALLALLRCRGRKVDADDTLALCDHREVDKVLPVGRVDVAAIQDDTRVAVSAQATHHLLDTLP
jgi:hypothetical protein